MYSDIFCKVYNEFGWNYYPEAFGEQLLKWLAFRGIGPKNVLDLGCGTGVLCRILQDAGMAAEGMDYSSGMVAIAREENPDIPFSQEDMITWQPGKAFDLVTCTGDALNHIPLLTDVARIFRNVYGYVNTGGYFIFDILNEHEVSDSEPFEMDFTETTRVWFQMTRPGEKQVNLKIRVYEQGKLSFEENIRETVHDPAEICRLLEEAGFTVERCADTLLEGENHGTTWFVIAKKGERGL
ncbi:MAG: class I SAM-dependent methyltransferase [Oscillospiraceae bacterium]|nr:class I SAM-dependent methyltransferase [Oscillospiraceae bacterium]